MGRDTEGGVQLTNAGFVSPVRMLGDVSDFSLMELENDLGQLLDRFTNRGSGYSLLSITKFVVSIARYNPLVGGSWLATPPELVNRMAIINVKNSDERCFQWAVLSALYPVLENAERVYLNMNNMSIKSTLHHLNFL